MTSDDISLDGQVAVVTGGGRGIGRAIALALAGAGAKIAVVARSENEIGETARRIEQGLSEQETRGRGVALAVAADVTDAREVAEAMRRIAQQLGPVDVLVNNAAALKPFGPFWETDVEEWWRTMEINLRGVALCTRAVLPGMVARRRGRIINVASRAGAVGAPFYSSYVSSKCALIRFTECLALEAAPHGVSLFAISPGTVRTAMTEYSLASEEGKKWLPWFRRIFEGKMDVPAERPAQLVLQLLSGKYDVFSGRMVSVFEDLEMLMKNATEIERLNLYILKMEGLKTMAGSPAMAAVLAAARNAAKTVNE